MPNPNSFFIPAEWFHRFIKADADHLNWKGPATVAFCRLAAQRVAAGHIQQLLGNPVEQLDVSFIPNKCTHEVQTPAGSMIIDTSTVSVDNTCIATQPLTKYTSLKHEVYTDGRLISHCMLHPGHVVRLSDTSAGCNRKTRLFVIDSFAASSPNDESSDIFVIAREATEETAEDRNNAIPIFDPRLKTHIRIVRAPLVSFRASSLWNKVYAPSALEVNNAFLQTAYTFQTYRCRENAFVFIPFIHREA